MVETLYSIVSPHVYGVSYKGFGNIQSKERKREQSLVDSAHHDTSIFFPVRDIAVVSKSRAHVPSQQTPADSPDKGKEAINRNIKVWFQAHAAVQDNGDCQRRDREERS